MLRVLISFFCFGALVSLVTLTSCKKPVFFSNGNLAFSTDTVMFDTVFTTIGSTTKNFKFYNNDSRTVAIEQIELMGGSDSPFRINVDGLSGLSFTDIEVEGNDSLYVFVEVTLDVNASVNPMVIEDSIRFRTNGVDQFVVLTIWGQDAYFHYKDSNEGVWPNDKPHVIYNYAGVDEDKTLTIQKNTQIYMHKDALLIVYRGTLNIEGELNEEVTIQGDRLEAEYDDVAGQFYGIYFQEARESKINYCNIKNGTAGIHVIEDHPANTGYTVTMTNSQITNCARYGAILYSGAKLEAENCILAKNFFHALAVYQADFNLNHCHLLGYSASGEQTPAVGISNVGYDLSTQEYYYGSINEGAITNSIIYGDLDQELVLDTVYPGAGLTFNFDFRYNLIRSETIQSGPEFSNNIWNDDPLFVSPSNGDFLYYSVSPMHEAGSVTIPNNVPESQFIGIRGIVRTGYDQGAYEIP